MVEMNAQNILNGLTTEQNTNMAIVQESREEFHTHRTCKAFWVHCRYISRESQPQRATRERPSQQRPAMFTSKLLY